MPKRLDPAFLAKATEMYESGMSFGAVAQELGHDPESLRQALIRRGLQPRSKNSYGAPNRMDPVEGVVVAYLDGESVLAISDRLGVSRTAITRWIREAGVPVRSRKEARQLNVEPTTPEERQARRNERLREYRARKKGTEPPEHVGHGSAAAIAIYGCGCGVCLSAKREYDRARRFEMRDSLREQARVYRLNNLNTLRDSARRHYEQNTETVKARAKAYSQTERGRMVARATFQRRRGVPFTEAGREYAAIVVKDPCSYCGGPGGTIDHIDAIVNGGNGDWVNLTGACGTCNSRKRAEPLLFFMLRLQRQS